MKKITKYLAIVLALVLLVSTMSPIGFADDVANLLKTANESEPEIEVTVEEPAAEPEIEVTAEEDTTTPGEGEGEGATTPGEDEGEGTTTPGEGEGEGTTTPGEGEGEGTTTPGEGEGEGTTTPGEGEGEGTTTPGEGEGEGTTTPGEGEGEGTTTPGEGEGEGTTTPGEGEGEGTTTPNVYEWVEFAEGLIYDGTEQKLFTVDTVAFGMYDPLSSKESYFYNVVDENGKNASLYATDAGTYTIAVDFYNDGELIGTAEGTVTIAKAPLPDGVKFEIEPVENLSYTGDSQTLAEIKGLTNADGTAFDAELTSCAWYVDGVAADKPTRTNADSYSVKAIAYFKNYQPDLDSNEVTATIAPAEWFERAEYLIEKNDLLEPYTGDKQRLLGGGSTNIGGPTEVTWYVNGEKVDGEYAEATNAGTYIVYGEVTSPNYKDSLRTNTVNATIAKKALTNDDLTVTANNRTYDGTAQALVSASVEGNPNVEYSYVVGESAKNEATDAGTYTVTVYATVNDANFEAVTLTKTVEVEIEKATVTDDDLVVKQIEGLVYTGKPQQLFEVTVNPLITNCVIEYTGGNEGTNAVNYEENVTLRVEDDPNFNDKELLRTVANHISKATDAKLELTVKNRIFDYESKPLVDVALTGLMGDDTATYTYYVNGEVAENLNATDAGTYNVKVVAELDSNNYDPAVIEATETVTISPVNRALYDIIITAKSDEAEYDGTAHELSGIASVTIGDKGYNFTYEDDKVVVEYKVGHGKHSTTVTFTISNVKTGVEATEKGEHDHVVDVSAAELNISWGNGKPNYDFQLDEIKGVNGQLVIKAKSASIEYTAAEPTYDGAEHALLTEAKLTGIADADAEKVKLQYSIDNGATWSDTIPAAAKAGEYVIDIKAVDAEGCDVLKNYTINPVEDVKVTIGQKAVTITVNNVTCDYDAAAHTVASADGKEYVVEGLVEGHTEVIDVKYLTADTTEGTTEDPDEVTEAGTYYAKVLETLGGQRAYAVTDAQGNDVTDNYAFTIVDGTLTINPAKITVTPDAAQFKYYMQADPDLSQNFTVSYSDGTEIGELADNFKDELIKNGFALERKLEEGDTDPVNDKIGDYEIGMIENATANTSNFDVKLAREMFSIKRLPVKVYPTDAQNKNYGVADNTESISKNFTVEFIELPVDKFTADMAKTEIGVTSFTREAGEAIGDYAYLFDGQFPNQMTGDAEAPVAKTIEHGNFEVTFTSEVSYTINPVVEIILKEIDTRTKEYSFELKNTAGEALAQPAQVTITADNSGDTTYLVDTIEETYVEGPIDCTTGAGTQAIEMRTYNVGGVDYEAYLPVNTVVTATATAANRAGEQVALTTATETNVQSVGTFAPAAVELTTSAAQYNLGDGVVLRKDGASMTAKNNSINEEVLVISVNGTVKDYQHLAAGASFTFDPASYGVEGSADPQSLAQVEVNYADDIHLSLPAAASKLVTMDNAALTSGSIEYENRGETLTFTLPELTAADSIDSTVNAGSNLTITVKVGDYTVTTDAVAGQTTYTVDFAEWMTAPTLFTTGTPITVSYFDRAGYEGVLSARPSQSDAQRSASIFIHPEPIYDTVGQKAGMKLELYGNAVEYEELIVTIAGRSYTVKTSGRGSYEHKGKGSWSLTVNLDDIDFPVDVPTTISVEYVNLNGGESSVELIYNDWCLPTLVTSPAMQNQSMLFGFAEPGSTIIVTHNGEEYRSDDGTGRIEVDQFGYYIVYLDNNMAAGDEITVQYIDFVQNESELITIVVPDIFDGKTKAQPLGANIVDRLYNEETKEWYSDHRFATPVEIDKLREAAMDEDEETVPSMELPILAYKGYEVGTMTITFEDEELKIDYEIEEDCLYEGADYVLRFYESKPDLETLLTDETPSEDIEQPIDVEPYGDRIWIYAEFDVNMDEMRIGRRVNFLVLTEESMDEELYEMYQRFQILD